MNRNELLQVLKAEGAIIVQNVYDMEAKINMVNNQQEWELVQIMRGFGLNPISFLNNGQPSIYMHPRLFRTQKQVAQALRDYRGMSKKEIEEQAKAIQELNRKNKEENFPPSPMNNWGAAFND